MKRLALDAFRHLPRLVRRLAVRAATPSFTVGAVVVLRRADGRVLLVEQRHSRGWTLPGGLLRRGETLQRGLAREVWEEVGVRLDPAALPVPFAAVDPRVRRVDAVFVVDDGGEWDPAPGDRTEITGIGWYPLDALPEVGEPTLDILGAVRLR